MVLDYLGQPAEYDRLLHLLRVDLEVGTLARHIQRLTELGVEVLYERGTLTDIHSHLEQGRPCLAFVRTGFLSYWAEDTGHALVVIGVDGKTLYVNDPAFDEAPRKISEDAFIAAWVEAEEYYAVLTQRTQ